MSEADQGSSVVTCGCWLSQVLDGGTFSEALRALRQGHRVRRQAWPAELALYLVDGSTFAVSRPPLDAHLPVGMQVNYASHIDWMRVTYAPAPIEAGVWSPTQEDILSEDWEVQGS